jgi:hypothetical protein
VRASGCIFSPDTKPPKVKPPIEYLAPISPQNVLQNLVKAYNGRDSIETMALYDDQYVGSSTSSDPTAPYPPYEFNKAMEVSHVHALHDNPNIVNVAIDLGAPATWLVLSPDANDPEWPIIYTNYQSIEIRDASKSLIYQSSNRQIQWKFKPTAHAGSDTTWAVIRWTETAN